MKSEETFYGIEITSRNKNMTWLARNNLFSTTAGPTLFYWRDQAVQHKKALKTSCQSSIKNLRVVKVAVRYTWMAVVCSLWSVVFSNAQTPPPIPVPAKRPAKSIPAPTSGSGAATLLSVKAAAIPVSPQILLTWTPTNVVWTQSITILDISNGIPVAWLTNRWTNLWEIQERVDSGPWTIKLITNRPPARLPSPSTGTLHQFRLRAFWDP